MRPKPTKLLIVQILAWAWGIITHNRVQELVRTLEQITTLPERPLIIIVGNASSNGTVAILAERFPEILVLALGKNLEAAARNIGVWTGRRLGDGRLDDDLSLD